MQIDFEDTKEFAKMVDNRPYLKQPRVTIVCTVYNEYELLRQLIESIFARVYSYLYEEIIIVDDYSKYGGRLREYEDYLFTLPKVKMINHDEYRYMVHYQKGDYIEKRIEEKGGFDYRKYDSNRGNLGHARAIWKGLREVKTEFALVIDIDCVLLSGFGGGLTEPLEYFDKNPKIIAAGQGTGINTNKIIEMKKRFKCAIPGITGGGGYVSPMITMLRMDAWNEYGLASMVPPAPQQKMGWPYNCLFEDSFNKGYVNLNYPYLSRGHVLHLGKGVARRNIGLDHDHERLISFGYCKDYHGRYGGRYGQNIIGGYYAGTKLINISSKELWEDMKGKYSTPFDEPQELFDEKLLTDMELAVPEYKSE